MSEQVTTVRIESSKLNKYSSIIRACITAGNAASILDEPEMQACIETVLALALKRRSNLLDK